MQNYFFKNNKKNERNKERHEFMSIDPNIFKNYFNPFIFANHRNFSVVLYGSTRINKKVFL